jgi:HD-GYP domain-containing protein (c-di-GMP phosphodiesterase class II)
MVADSFDALTTDRPYRQAVGVVAAFAELIRCSGKQFDPTVVDAFRTLIDQRIEKEFGAQKGPILQRAG